MGRTSIILSFLSLLPCYWPRWQLVILFFPLDRSLLAPLFSLIVVWPFRMIAQFVYVLGETLCPLADRALRALRAYLCQLSSPRFSFHQDISARNEKSTWV